MPKTITALLASLLAALALAGGAAALPEPTSHPFLGGATAQPTTLAVIGDTPYGEPQRAAFPSLVADINADPDVDVVLHVGDIKTGSSACTDEYFSSIRALFETFEDPLVYTPGDNEWTDCHRAKAGGYLPTERLEEVRETFYPVPGVTLGEDRFVLSQAVFPRFSGFPENQLWLGSRTVFAAVHVVGSNNDLEPWFGAAETAEQRALRLAEYSSRLEADLAWLELTFAVARATRARGVVLAMQADMWDAFSVANGRPLNGFDPIVERIAKLSSRFGRPVLLLQGDSHDFLVDRPLAVGSPIHGVTTKAPNVLRIVVEGETVSEWLRLTVNPAAPQVFSYERVSV